MNSGTVISLLIFTLWATAFRVEGNAADRKTPAAWVREGMQHDLAERTSEALTCFQQALKVDPNWGEAHWRISKQYCDLMFEAASSKESKRLALLALTHAEKAVALLPEEPMALLSEAICIGKNFPFISNREKIEGSRRIKSLAEHALRNDPKSDLAHHLLGRWHLETAEMSFLTRKLAQVVYSEIPRGSFDEAVQHFNQAVERDPQRVIHHYYLALALKKQGKAPEFHNALKAAVSCPPKDKDDGRTLEEAKILHRKVVR